MFKIYKMIMMMMLIMIMMKNTRKTDDEKYNAPTHTDRNTYKIL